VQIREAMLSISGAALLACACAACGSEVDPAGAPRPTQADAADGGAPSAGDESRAQRRERPLPSFSGSTLAGERFSISSALGKRLLIFFFDPGDAEAAVVAGAVAKLSPLRGAHNFEILGVASGSSREAAQAFVAQQALDFRVLDDSSAQVARTLGLRTPVAILGIDAEGYVVFGRAQFATQAPNASRLIDAQLRPISLGGSWTATRDSISRRSAASRWCCSSSCTPARSVTKRCAS
jgi:peroxiredoxin